MRNEVVHGKIVVPVEMLVEKAMEWHASFKVCNAKPEVVRVPCHARWINPPANSFILNCDGIVFVIIMGSFFVVLLEMGRVGWRSWVLNW